jgi:hypothetical protein
MLLIGKAVAKELLARFEQQLSAGGGGRKNDQTQIRSSVNR